MLTQGVYPAMVTPMHADGGVCTEECVQLLARFEVAGCAGVVLAGTNGEGPSLSAVEKRDLVRVLVPAATSLAVILGVATPSLSEAHWSCESAAKAGATAVLLMPPGYFRSAPPEGIEAWLLAVADRSPLPLILYNFPRMVGFPLEERWLAELGAHANIAGFKDSSGDVANLESYRRLVPEKALFVGDERLLLDAMQAGWNGTISGAANLVATWLVEVVRAYQSGNTAAAVAKFALVAPVIDTLRSLPQPATNKAALHAFGALRHSAPRLPLLAVDPTPALEALAVLGGVS